MLLFTNWNIYREPEVVLETGRDRDHCSALFFLVYVEALYLLNGLFRDGVDRFAPRCNNAVLFSPIGWVEYLPTLGSGAD
jgi:hypothetical protein